MIAIAGHGDNFPGDFQTEGEDVLILRYRRAGSAQPNPDGADKPVSPEADEEVETGIQFIRRQSGSLGS